MFAAHARRAELHGPVWPAAVRRHQLHGDHVCPAARGAGHVELVAPEDADHRVAVRLVRLLGKIAGELRGTLRHRRAPAAVGRRVDRQRLRVLGQRGDPHLGQHGPAHAHADTAHGVDLLVGEVIVRRGQGGPGALDAGRGVALARLLLVDRPGRADQDRDLVHEGVVAATVARLHDRQVQRARPGLLQLGCRGATRPLELRLERPPLSAGDQSEPAYADVTGEQHLDLVGFGGHERPTRAAALSADLRRRAPSHGRKERGVGGEAAPGGESSNGRTAASGGGASEG
ncbi:hypothetical protein ACFQY4_39170 [Catellatospora bangladeshensis]|uniref:hypothetical protein n=1 Tax=Catellatospora bangladeshensis TaxID=310355 RepID=UPI0036074CCD